MVPTIRTFGLEQLPVEHKLALVEELWDNIAKNPEMLPVPPSHWAELERRLAVPETEPGQAWEEVRREIESEL